MTPPSARVDSLLTSGYTLPEPLRLDDPTRQARRRAERGQARCSLCLRPCTYDDICFANGKDAHRSCAETLNEAMIEARQQIRDQGDDRRVEA